MRSEISNLWKESTIHLLGKYNVNTARFHLNLSSVWTEMNARKMDMLNTDLLLKNEAANKTKGKKRKADEDDSESGFHFIAFTPIEGQLWKLDGLERQPMCLGMKLSDS